MNEKLKMNSDFWIHRETAVLVKNFDVGNCNLDADAENCVLLSQRAYEFVKSKMSEVDLKNHIADIVHVSNTIIITLHELQCPKSDEERCQYYDNLDCEYAHLKTNR